MLELTTYPPEFELGLRAREVRLPRCGACGRFHWYPMPRCPHCLSPDIAWERPGGVATVFTCSTVSHAFDPGWAEALPYAVALVEYSGAPGVRLVGQLVGDEPGSASIGTVVEPVFLTAGTTPRLAFRAAARDAPND